VSRILVFEWYGIAISLDLGKVLDTEVMSRYCKPCKECDLLHKQNKEQFDEWYQNHDCQLNHTGSAGSFSRSETIMLHYCYSTLEMAIAKGYEVAKSV